MFRIVDRVITSRSLTDGQRGCQNHITAVKVCLMHARRKKGSILLIQKDLLKQKQYVLL